MVSRKISAPEVRFSKTKENIIKLEDTKVLPSVSRALKKIQKLGRVSELDPSELIIGETAIQIEPAIDGKSLRFKTLRAFKKGRGDATKTMKLVQGIAEDEGVNLTSKVNAFGKDGMTNKQLDSWYRRLGWMDGDREGEIMFMGEPLVLSGNRMITIFVKKQLTLHRAHARKF